MKPDEKKRLVYSTIKDEMGFKRLPPPKPGDWLYAFHEDGQTVEEYKIEVKNLKTDKRTTIYIQPLGDLDERFSKILDEMKNYAEAFFSSKVILNKAIPIPKESFNKNRAQFDAEKILIVLEKTRPADALAYVGVMEKDLYVEGLNFVFGLGSFDKRVGVYSLARYGDDYKMRLKRALKVMVHEIGHILSMRHCIFYKCIMNGSNFLKESDGRPMHLCPVCFEKLNLSIGIEKAEHYRRLWRFYSRVGFKEEADFAKNLMERWDPIL